MTMCRALIERAAPIGVGVLIVIGLAAAACDTAPLTAPTNSSITMSISTAVLPVGGTAEITAFVSEQGGTPVQNGTMVRFATNLGRVDPVQVETRKGFAVTTFHAGDTTGVADIRATSGAIGAASGTTGNLVQITVFDPQQVETVTLTANPGSVPATGGTVDLIATVVAVTRGPAVGVPVTFTASDGQLAATRVVTDGNGQARTQLTTSRAATVTANSGTKTSNAVTVAVQTPPPTPNVTLAATPETATNLGQRWNFTATVTGTDALSLPSRYDWDFGDGVTLTTNGNLTSHVYTIGGIKRTVSVRVTLANGQAVSTTTEIIIAVLPP